MSKVNFVNKDNFNNVINNGTVMIKFTASWCQPCKAMDPVLETVAEKLPDDCKIFKLDIDEAHEIAAKYKVKTIPTLMVFKKGELTKTQIGRTSAENVTKLFE